MRISIDDNSRLVIADYADNKRPVAELKVTRYNKIVGFFLEKLGYAVALSVGDKTFYANKLSIGREYVQKVKHNLSPIDDKIKRVGYEEFLQCSGLSKEKIEEKKQTVDFVSTVNKQAAPNVDYHRLAKDLHAVLLEGERHETIQLLAKLQKDFESFPHLKLPGQSMTVSQQLGYWAEKLKGQENNSFSDELWDFSTQLLKITENTEYSSWHT